MPLSGPEKGMTGSAQEEGEPWPISLRERSGNAARLGDPGMACRLHAAPRPSARLPV